uniref:Uncharacterized protein n=1 Tax=viral metagenome TaxID=1070528 RepID=A0A6C0EEP5_9ZZZZ
MNKPESGNSRVKITKDIYNDKKYNIKITGCGGGQGEERNFFKLLSQLDGFIGFTTNKEYNSAFFYVKEDFCSLRVFLKRIVDSCGYGSGYSEDGGSGCGCISYDQAIFMADSLCRQVILFAGYGWGFYCFSLDNVYVVDNHNFIYLGIEHLIEVGEKIIHFTVPFREKTAILQGGGGDTNLFICPEIKNIKQLPSNIRYSATYYHLASLIIYCMFHKNICFSGVGVEVGDEGDHGGDNGGDNGGVQTLSAIVNTKLYWFLIRCLHNDDSKRILLWI